ncbi:insulinoma-associated protein 2 [Protobothrops mucrosquamatus]|uniref:insulinoma-associated protein 2 n=1 Tax=Protobothrops mucrosquamatus TaxID=103944 RepID=UPI0010FB875B|nr:insulinoma-associated protein 2 [Protobothrops mucrosquamatus]
MPRGFLVKRSRRPGGSYRMRPAGGPSALRLEEAPRLATPLPEAPPQPQQLPQPNSPVMVIWDAGGSDSVVSAADEPRRYAPSSVSAESSPLGPALALAEKLPLIPRTPVPLPAPLPLPAASLCPAIPLKRPSRAKAPPAKKPKAVRKLSFADEVTTSPVLGLRIKTASEAGGEGIRVARPTLLGEFVCQLCKEPYADPLALAQHRCSRIVRVEYRCPECHKIFSCPANLASHRRWHKPRPTTSAGPTRDKENSRGEAGRDQHHGSADSSCCRDQPAPRASQLGPGSEATVYFCPYCHKSFRRQAYLRKHLGTHQAGIASFASNSPSHPLPQQIAFSCHLCGAHFPSADIRDKHRVWHTVREELLLPLGQPEGSANHGEQQIFSCKHCPSTFFSSPGLTRHINKCHPSENRQVLLLQMSVRPGC